MPLNSFRCPDGVRVATADCLSSCRLRERCVPELILRAIIGKERAPAALPSVTQLVTPTRVAYLEATTGYAIAPVDSLWSLRGSAMHTLIADQPPPGWVIERRFANEYMTGQPDAYEEATATLYDWKSCAVYKQKLMMSDVQPAAPDYVRQLNGYRILCEAANLPVRRLVLVAVTRDYRNCEYEREVKAYKSNKQGGGRVAPPPVPPIVQYVIPVQEDAEDWFRQRAVALRHALDTHELPPLCDEEERWRDTRCKRWCNAAANCPYGQQFKTGGVI